jgi:hypothetical protein
MKKQLVIIGISLVLLAVGLSGCTNNNGGGNIEDKFVGKWTCLSGDYLIGNLEFYSDGLARTTHIVDAEVISTHSATWEVNGDKLIVNETDSKIVITYRYTFSNDQTLVLTEVIMGNDYGPYTYKKS